jgi:predicted dehydrogenase
MSNNVMEMEMYDWLVNINSLDFHDKTALIIGGSDIAKQYALGLVKLGIKDITIIAKTGNYISDFCKEQNIKIYTGGFEHNISLVDQKDITIVAPPIQDTINATKMAIKNNQKNILIEKPGSLYYKELKSLLESFPEIDIRIAYNRLAYPNFYKLKELVAKEGGITSCRFTFTERLGTMDFTKDIPKVYQRWGISNSLHVIIMAFELIGMPKEIHSNQYGNLEWHPSGSIFVGNGLSDQNIPFSYHADWGSGGRWGIEVNTKQNSYQLIPLEEIYACKKDTGIWDKVSFQKAFPDLKQGIAEEVAIMLNGNNKFRHKMLSLEKATQYNKIAEKIFGYNKMNN